MIVMKDIFLKLMFNVLKIYVTFAVIKLAANLHDKKEYAIDKRSLKQVLNHRIVLKKCIESCT